MAAVPFYFLQGGLSRSISIGTVLIGLSWGTFGFVVLHQSSSFAAFCSDVFMESVNTDQKYKLLTFLIMSPLPNDMHARVNWLALTSYNRVKGHIMWINVSLLDNDYLLIIENIWKNSK